MSRKDKVLLGSVIATFLFIILVVSLALNMPENDTLAINTWLDLPITEMKISEFLISIAFVALIFK